MEEQRLSDLFPSINTPSLTDEQTASLEGELTITEIIQAINSLKLGRCPGNDGFPSDLYLCGRIGS